MLTPQEFIALCGPPARNPDWLKFIDVRVRNSHCRLRVTKLPEITNGQLHFNTFLVVDPGATETQEPRVVAFQKPNPNKLLSSAHDAESESSIAIAQATSGGIALVGSGAAAVASTGSAVSAAGALVTANGVVVTTEAASMAAQWWWGWWTYQATTAAVATNAANVALAAQTTAFATTGLAVGAIASVPLAVYGGVRLGKFVAKKVSKARAEREILAAFEKQLLSFPLEVTTNFMVSSPGKNYAVLVHTVMDKDGPGVSVDVRTGIGAEDENGNQRGHGLDAAPGFRRHAQSMPLLHRHSGISPIESVRGFSSPNLFEIRVDFTREGQFVVSISSTTGATL
ncbi:hypothetical protein HDU98_012363 [Podochytrium sp. JEL0797]|nr:hypothetical protein HDU98_012363 [Podochytrium sp. JEL0797]